MNIASCKVGWRGKQAIEDKVGALNKRAAKHSMEGLQVVVTGIDGFVPVSRGVMGVSENVYKLVIMGNAPTIEGWRLVARVMLGTSVGNLVRVTPGYRGPGFEKYREGYLGCDHCGFSRRRKDVYILEDSSGCRKCVGRNCLADFLRSDSADDLARFAEYADLIVGTVNEVQEEAEECTGCAGPPVMNLEAYLTIVAMLVRRCGWTSRSKANEEMVCSTCELAREYLFSKSSYTRAFIEEESLYTEGADNAAAKDAIKWARGVSGGEYLYTISKIARAGVVEFAVTDGFAASIISAYNREKRRRAGRADKSEELSTGRIKGVEVKCTGVHPFEGRYGPGTVIRFETETAVLVWFASGAKETEWTVGDDYTVDCTVKSFADTKYGKQNKVNRVKKA